MGNPVPVLRRRIRRIRQEAGDQLRLLRARATPGIDDLSPQLLGIGAARSATGWLHQQLSSHPRMFLPRAKEVHFFDTRSTAQLQSELYWRTYWLQFAGGEGQIRADITPAYGLLPADKIDIIFRRMPDAQLVYLLRDPVERAWSGIRHRLWYGKGLKVEEVSDRDLLPHLQNEEVLDKGNYWDSITRWLAYYPRGQLFCGLHDDVARDPADLMRRLCAFIGVDAEPILRNPEFSRRVNAVPASGIPAAVRERLGDYYRPQIEALESNLGLALDSWRR